MTKTIRSAGHDALCRALITARQQAGLTQAELAQRLQCHQSFVARIETGQRRIDVVELIVIARSLGTDVHHFIDVVGRATSDSHRI